MRQIANRMKNGLHKVCLGLATMCAGFVNDVKLDAPLSYSERFFLHRVCISSLFVVLHLQASVLGRAGALSLSSFEGG